MSDRVLSWTFVGRQFTDLSFWELHPQDLEPCCSSESNSSLIIPTIVQRAFGGVIDACSRLPHDIDECFKGWRRLFHPERTISFDGLRGGDM